MVILRHFINRRFQNVLIGEFTLKLFTLCIPTFLTVNLRINNYVHRSYFIRQIFLFRGTNQKANDLLQN